VTRRSWIALSLGLALALILAALLNYLLRPKAPPRLTLAPVRYDQLRGWRDDRLAAALPALLRSCAAVLKKPDGATT
jgi:hypothetical protein